MANLEAVLEGYRNHIASELESSDKAIYVFLTNKHKFCNRKFTELLGYESPEEWAAAEGEFTELYVAEESRSTLVRAYFAAGKGTNSTIPVTWITKAGEPVKTTVEMQGVEFDGERLALHYITVA
jgi:hypothetical protein